MLDDTCKHTHVLQRERVYTGLDPGLFHYCLQFSLDGYKFGKLKISYSGDDNGNNGIYIIPKILDTRISIKEVSCGKEHVLLLTSCGTLFSYGLGR